MESVGETMLAIIGAMSEEIKGIRRLMSVEGEDSLDGLSVCRGSYRGKSLLLAKGGVGKQRAQRSARHILDHYPVTAMVMVGFAGALKPGLKAGDVATCALLRCADGNPGEEYACDSRLLSAARACKTAECRHSIGVTALDLVCTEMAKREMCEATSADVVDMESYWIAQIAAENRIPFITIRAVSDTAMETLPDLPSWRWKTVVPYFAAHPEIGFSLYRNLLRARKNLTVFAVHMVESIG